MFKKFVEKYWLLFFFVGLFVFMAFFRISFKDVWQTILTLRLWQLIVLLALYFLISFSFICVRKYLLYALNHSCSLRNLTYIHFSSLAAHYSTPVKIGFPLAVYLLKRFENIPYPQGTAVVLIELTVSTGICGMIAIFGGFFYFEKNSHDLFLIFLIAIVVISFLAGVTGFVVKKRISNSRLGKFISDTGSAFAQVALSHIILYTGMMILTQFFSSLSLVLLCDFFSVDLSLGQALTAGSTAFFIGAISMIPMGLGTRDASLLFYLKLLGVSGGIGISIVTVQRLLSTGLSFVLGMIFSGILGIKNIRNQNSLDITKN
jgi:uncharacterized protein (TIRG00374 family)